MSNLWSGNIATEGQYVSLAEKSGLSFSSGTKYTIQCQNPTWVREGEIGRGFFVSDDKPFDYTAGNDTLFIKTDYAFVNIAD